MPGMPIKSIVESGCLKDFISKIQDIIIPHDSEKYALN